MAVISGTVWMDKNGNGVMDANEPPLAGFTIQIIDINGTFGNAGNVLLTATTDGSGLYVLGDITPYAGVNCQIKLFHSNEWFVTAGSDDTIVVVSSQTNRDIGLQPRCQYVASPWVVKVCWIPNVGVKVTFKDYHGPFTCIYPSMSQQDYGFLATCGCPGHMIDTQYKCWPYYTTTVSP